MAHGHWIVALVFAAGCGGKTTPDDDPTGANGNLTPSPGGTSTCEAPATADTSYRFCRWEGPSGYESFCEKSYDGWGYLNWHTDANGGSYCSNDASCNTCSCFISCRVGPAGQNDCPPPETGTAQPDCLGVSSSKGTCLLTCDNGEQCPSGMQCVESNEFGRRVCAWVCNR